MRHLPLLWVMLAWPLSARADSDGYYCHGPGYIAWETRFSAPDSGHVLHVVRYSRATGIQLSQRVVLPDFQVHGMVCDGSAVVVVGWTARYRVDLTASTLPVVRTETAAFNTAAPPPALNFGSGARARVTELSTVDGTGGFELVVARVSRRVNGGIDHHTSARIVQRQPGPRAAYIASQMLMEGIYRETIDGQ
jgi:hypothetical protein